MTMLEREVRVFISSTFRDMQAERDHLIRNVFPELRARCRARAVTFTEVDLRWGITEEEASNGGVVAICLQEIDRSRPYFIGLLGERYGWVPDSEADRQALLDDPNPDLPAELPDWLRDGYSATAMEIHYGVLARADRMPHAFFYLRDPALTDQLAAVAPVAERALFFETNPRSRERLEALKQQVRQPEAPWHCPVTPYGDLATVGQWILEDLWRVIEAQFPAAATPSPLERERRFHQVFAENRLQSYVPPAATVRAAQQALAEGVRLLVVTGESGSGKSALLAYLAAEWRRSHPAACVIEHFVGAGGEVQGNAIVRRMMREVQAHCRWPEAPPPPDETLREQFPLWLARAGAAEGRVLLVLDALNQLPASEQKLDWWPCFVPAGVQVVCSALPGQALQTLEARLAQAEFASQRLTVAPLTEERPQIIEHVLGRFRKRLTPAQIARILAAPTTRNPLFLSVLLEELRLHGRFETLDQTLADYLAAADPGALFELLLQRWEHDYGAEAVRETFCLLWASRRGLTEDELRVMARLSPLALSRWRLAVDFHLVHREGLLDFAHDYLRRAVARRYLSGGKPSPFIRLTRQPSPNGARPYGINARVVNTFRQQLADFFASQPFNARQAEELPWQLSKAGQTESLRAYIQEWPVFKWFSTQDRYWELQRYWQAVHADWQAVINHYCAQIVDEDESAALGQLCRFLEQAGWYRLAESLQRRLFQLVIQQYGEDHPATATALNDLAGLLRDQNRYAEAEPLYRQALALRQRILGQDHPATATALNDLACLFYSQGRYTEAEPLFRHALALRQRILGEDHPATATSLNDLACLFYSQGRYTEAEPLFRHALALRQRVLGDNHPDTAHSLHNLADLRLKQGRYDEAESLYRHALTIRQRVLGNDHPNTATTLNDLATLLQQKGFYSEAIFYCLKAFNIRQHIFGVEHPDTLASCSLLIELFHRQGNYNQAEAFCRKIFEIRQQILGEEHPETTTSLNKIALLTKRQLRYDEAETLYRKLFTIYEKCRRYNEAIDCLESLVEITAAQGRKEVAQALEEKADLLRETVSTALI